MKIGLYTIHASHNVGAMLQAYALTTKLQQLGAEVELVNMYPLAEEIQNHHRTKGGFLHNIVRDTYLLMHPSIRKMESNFDAFHEQMPLSQRFLSAEDYIKSPNSYDLHLVGSDQVWNVQKGYEFAKFYFLDYLPKDAIRKSYGASFGTTEDVHSLKEVGNALSKFEAISVREDRAVSFVNALIGKQVAHVVDPTLLLTSSEWDDVIDEKPTVDGDYIFFYGVNTDSTTWRIIELAKKKYNLPVVGYPGPLKPQYRFDKFILDGGPKQFVNLIKNAKLVITSSFHGLAFSINYDVPFMLINYSTRMERMDSLVKLLAAEDHLVGSEDDAENYLNSNHCSLSRNLHVEREKSIEWIKRNIL